MLKVKIKNPQVIKALKRVTIEDEDHAYIEKITGAHVPSLSSCWIPLRPEVVEAEEIYNQYEKQKYEQTTDHYKEIAAIHRPFNFLYGGRVRSPRIESRR
jgi:hypothetical protein